MRKLLIISFLALGLLAFRNLPSPACTAPTPYPTPTPGSSSGTGGMFITSTPLSYSCPTGLPFGYGSVTPDANYMVACSSCLPTTPTPNPFTLPTMQPPGACLEPTFSAQYTPVNSYGTPIPKLQSCNTSTPTPGTPTVTPTPTITPTVQNGNITTYTYGYNNLYGSPGSQTCRLENGNVYCEGSLSGLDVSNFYGGEGVGWVSSGNWGCYSYVKITVTGTTGNLHLLGDTGYMGTIPGTYQWYNGCSGNPIMTQWNFRDGTGSTWGQYMPGSYTITWNVCVSHYGFCDYVAPNTVTATPTPIASPTPGGSYCGSIIKPSPTMPPIITIPRDTYQCFVIPGFNLYDIIGAISWALPSTLSTWASSVVIPGTTVCVFTAVFGIYNLFGTVIDIPIVISAMIVAFVLKHFMSK